MTGEAELGLFGVSVLSALVPVVNLEVYLVGMAAVAETDRLWLLATVAGVGQMVGKLAWYLLGANSLRWGWVRRRAEKPGNQAALERWRLRTHERPLLGALLLFVSALTGFPPFAVVAVLAGQLRMNLAVFLAGGTAGRTLRFAAVLGGADWLADWVPGLS